MPARWAPLATAGAVALATLALHVRDPHESGSWGYCPWSLLTGGYCPGCGSLRAVNDLTRGDVAGAASSNLLLVAAIPVVVVTWVLWARAAARGERLAAPGWVARHSRLLGVAAVVLTVVFTVLRNLPGSWLAP